MGKNLKVAAADRAPMLTSATSAESLEASGRKLERKAARFQRVVRDLHQQNWLLGFSLGPAQPLRISRCYSQVMSRMDWTTNTFVHLRVIPHIPTVTEKYDGLKCATALSFTRYFLPYCFHSASTLGPSDAVEARKWRGRCLPGDVHRVRLQTESRRCRGHCLQGSAPSLMIFWMTAKMSLSASRAWMSLSAPS